MRRMTKTVLISSLLFILFQDPIRVHAMMSDNLYTGISYEWSSDGQSYYENGKKVTGQKYIDGYWYYFDESTGKMVHGWKYIASQKKKVWYGQETGHMLYGEVRIDGHWHYLDDVTGAVTYGWKYIKSKNITVYYDKNGYMVYGQQTIDGKSYEFDKSTGALIKGTSPLSQSTQSSAVTNGWNSAKDMYYVDGKKVTGQKYIDGYWYYFDDSTGKMVHGFKYIANQKKTVWYGLESGHMLYGQQRLNGYWYYLNDVTGAVTYGWKYIKDQDKTVYYDKDGHMVYGKQTIDGKEYEFHKTTGALISEGAALTETPKPTTVTDGWNSSKDKYYENGNYVTGLKQIDGNWYCFDQNTGVMMHGWVEIGSDKYYFGDNGIMYVGQHTIDGITYDFDQSTGKLIGVAESIQNGWNQDKTMFYSDGKQVTGEKHIDGYWYYFDDSTGVKVTGWKTITKLNKTVYYDENGRMVYGEKYIDGFWYYFNDVTGAMTHGWKYIPNLNKTVWYGQETGHMLYGQQRINGNWYYLHDVTGARISGWKYIKEQDKKVYYDKNGCMVYGIQTIDGKTYEFNKTTGALIREIKDNMVQNGWNQTRTMYFNNYKYVTGQKKIDNNWYYFDTNGIKKTGKVSIPASANSGTSKNVLTDKDGAYITHNTKQGLVYYSISSATDSVNVGKINYEKKIVKEGIDVSQWNGNFDFTSYKNQFVIIRASWGQTHKDTKVEQFVSECERLGIPYGFYTYSYAENNTEAKKEATFVLSIIDDLKKKHGGSLKHFCMGVWFDMEDADHWKARHGFAFTNANISGLCYTFCNEISKRGYYTGTYMSASWLKYLKGSKADSFDKWVAHWGTRNSYGDMSSDTSASGTMQQYTSTGGKLDKDVIFVDPSTYKNK